jgi:tetratricopeptide (TPR) repeat protein
MHLFSHQTTARPDRLLLALILSASLLTACGKEDSAALLAEARTMIAAGDYKAAAIQLKNALNKNENNAEVRFELGKLYLDQLDLASAEKEFRRAREAGYEAKIVNPLIARALLGQREFERVLEELPAPAEASPETATLLALRATAELALERKEEAAERPSALKARPAIPRRIGVARCPGRWRCHKALQEIDRAGRRSQTPRH